MYENTAKKYSYEIAKKKLLEKNMQFNRSNEI